MVAAVLCVNHVLHPHNLPSLGDGASSATGSNPLELSNHISVPTLDFFKGTTEGAHYKNMHAMLIGIYIFMLV